jgi:predicted anti-sigma-YlaC factor YlaD
MSCESYQETLSAFLDGNSAEREAADAFRHLAECAVCRTFLRSAIELQHGLRAMPVPDLPTRVDRRVMQIPSREKARQRNWPARLTSLLQHRFNVPVPALAGGAGLLLVVLGFSIWLLTRQGLVPERQIIYVVSTPTVEVYGIRTTSKNSQQ